MMSHTCNLSCRVGHKSICSNCVKLQFAVTSHRALILISAAAITNTSEFDFVVLYNNCDWTSYCKIVQYNT
jgi:hypothetical protein